MANFLLKSNTHLERLSQDLALDLLVDLLGELVSLQLLVPQFLRHLHFVFLRHARFFGLLAVLHLVENTKNKVMEMSLKTSTTYMLLFQLNSSITWSQHTIKTFIHRIYPPLP